MGKDVAIPHGQPGGPAVRIMAGMCSTCVFRRGNLMHLQPGRLKGMIASARRMRGHITCHQTLGADADGAVCRGYVDSYPGECDALLVGRLFRCLVSVTPTETHVTFL